MNLIDGLSAQKSLKYEFAKLGLDSVLKGEFAAHCKECIKKHHPIIRWYWLPYVLVWSGLLGAILAMGLALNEIFIVPLLELFVVSLLMFISSIPIWVLMVMLRRLRRQYINRPPVQVIPDIRSVDVLEEINGEITLENDGTYISTMNLRHDTTSELKFLDGVIAFHFGLKSSERDRLEQYLKKYRAWNIGIWHIISPICQWVQELEIVKSVSWIKSFLEYVMSQNYNWKTGEGLLFHGGFAVLIGTPNLLIQSDIPNNSDSKLGTSIDAFEQINTLALTDQIERDSFLGGNRTRSKGEWDKHLRYSVEIDEESSNLPLQLIPSLPQDSDRHTLALTVQIPIDEERFDLLKPIKIKRLLLYIPHYFGDVTKDRPRATHHYKGPIQEVKWENYDIRKVGGSLPQEFPVSFDSEEGKGTLHREFLVSFKNKIGSSDILNGEIELHLASSFSKLEEIAFFYPWGEKRQSITKNSQRTILTNQETIVTVKFKLHLGGLRSQEQVMRSFGHKQIGTTPDYKIVNKLTRNITKADFYIKSIIENPPRISKKGSGITNRSWDVMGRYYENMYPIDFHLTITGEEVETDLDESEIRVDGTVQGDVIDTEMFNKVEEMNNRLSDIIEDTLQDSSHNQGV
ncbi:MAG: hypothetical protein AAF702_34360 [Chloroflexota bacterium]